MEPRHTLSSQKQANQTHDLQLNGASHKTTLSLHWLECIGMNDWFSLAPFPILIAIGLVLVELCNKNSLRLIPISVFRVLIFEVVIFTMNQLACVHTSLLDYLYNTIIT